MKNVIIEGCMYRIHNKIYKVLIDCCNAHEEWQRYDDPSSVVSDEVAMKETLFWKVITMIENTYKGTFIDYSIEY